MSDPCGGQQSMGMVMSSLQEQLQQSFGFSSFREGQEEVITKLLAGQSVLAVFPTGAGKSLCYQLPAILLDGITLVISPLIALMKDQLDFLVRKGVPAKPSHDASESQSRRHGRGSALVSGAWRHHG